MYNSTLSFSPNTYDDISNHLQYEVVSTRPMGKVRSVTAHGNYVMAGFKVTLKRHTLIYIFNSYIPTGVFVLASWVSFIIPPDIVPGRMGLLVTMFLVLVNVFLGIQTVSPNHNNPTALCLWMLSCNIFVLGAFLEYAHVMYRKRQVSKTCQVAPPPAKSLVAIRKNSDDLFGVKMNKTDKFCIVLFPLAFCGFTLIYAVVVFCTK